MMKLESYWIENGTYPKIRLLVTDDQGNILKSALITVDPSIADNPNKSIKITI